MRSWQIHGGDFDGEVLVGESNRDCAVYTQTEWENEATADFAWTTEGGLVFQGEPFACDAVRPCVWPGWAQNTMLADAEHDREQAREVLQSLALQGPRLRILNEHGQNTANANVQHVAGDAWLYVDDLDGYSLTTTEDLADAILIEYDDYQEPTD